MLGQIMEQAGIPILIGMVCLYFAYRVLILKDIKAIRGKDKPEPEDKEGYCRDIGRLLVFSGYRQASCFFWPGFFPDGYTGDGPSDGSACTDSSMGRDHVHSLEESR